jgi:hypothetical protein
MRKAAVVTLAGIMAINMIGCGNQTVEAEEEKYMGEEYENYELFPASVEGFIGDTMPFYDDGKYNVFYLADQRNGKQGYHPWALIQTTNFTEYDDKGVVINSVGNMFTPFFQDEAPHNFKDANKSNLDEFARFWRYMLSNGVYFSPSQFTANFISIQHTEDYLSDVLEIAKGY